MKNYYLFFFTLIVMLSMSCRNEEKQFEDDLEAIENYIAENNLDAQSTASGLHYVVLEEGTGTVNPDIFSQVEVTYRGEFLSGEIFEKQDDPTSFALSGVIEGWREGLQLMTTGAKFQLLIPSRLAYGESGRGNIDPDTPLFFEIELLDVISEDIVFENQMIEIAQYAESKGYDYQVTNSGLHYVVVEEGTGTEMPGPMTNVTCTYRGEFLSGGIFDSSSSAIDFRLDNVIAGWTEGVQLMKKEAIFYLIIPSRLAYGQQGQNSIPPNTPLFFEINLIDF